MPGHTTYETLKFGADVAGGYDRAVGRASQIASAILIERANDALPFDKDSAVLEFGAGTGATTLLLAERYPETTIVATDISDPMLNILRTKRTTEHHIETRIQDMRNVNPGQEGYERGKYSHIISTMSIFTLDDPIKTFTQWKELLRPNGVMAITSWDFDKPVGPYEIWIKSAKAVDPSFKPMPLIKDGDKSPQTLGMLTTTMREAGLGIVNSQSAPLKLEFDEGYSFIDLWWNSNNPFTIKHSEPFKGDREAVQEEMRKVLREDYDGGSEVSLYGSVVIARKAASEVVNQQYYTLAM